MIVDAQIAAIEPARGDVVFCAAGYRTQSYEGAEKDRNNFFTEALLKIAKEKRDEIIKGIADRLTLITSVE